jgi:hypothetical protein
MNALTVTTSNAIGTLLAARSAEAIKPFLNTLDSMETAIGLTDAIGAGAEALWSRCAHRRADASRAAPLLRQELNRRPGRSGESGQCQHPKSSTTHKWKIRHEFQRTDLEKAIEQAIAR